jgi:hypothetical protein
MKSNGSVSMNGIFLRTLALTAAVVAMDRVPAYAFDLAPGASVSVTMECDLATGKCDPKDVSAQKGSAKDCRLMDEAGRLYKSWLPRDGVCYAEDGTEKQEKR